MVKEEGVTRKAAKEHFQAEWQKAENGGQR